MPTSNPDAARAASMIRGLRAALIMDCSRIDDLTQQLSQQGLSLSCELSLARDLCREYEKLIRKTADRLLAAAEGLLCR